MRFDVADEPRLFGESVRGVLGGWEPPLEPELGSWLDDRDDALARRLADVGWHELRHADGAAVVAGGIELGRACAPLCLLDEAALGAPLAVHRRVRHGAGAELAAVPLAGWRLGHAAVAGTPTREPTLDGTGTVVAELGVTEPRSSEDAAARWSAWTAATLAYLAGLASAALDAAVEHARVREQFGRPLARLPAVQARLADGALAVAGLELSAWATAPSRATPGAPGERPRDEPGLPSDSLLQGGASALLWAGSACREVTASAHQVHGALGFALETGLHRYHRRAKAVQAWTDAVCRACA